MRRAAASAPADRPGCRSAGHNCSRHCGWSHQLAHLVMRRVAHVDAEHVRTGLEQFSDHRAVRRHRAEGCEDLDATEPSHCLGAGAGGRPGPLCGLDRPGTPPGPPGPIVPGIPGTRCAGLLVGFGQLHGPCSLFAGVDFEEPGAVVAARQAILGALDGEFLVTRTHEGLSRPFAAAVIVERVDVIVTAPQGFRAAASRNFATTRSTSPRWSSPRHPCSPAQCRPGWRCCCRAGNRPPPDCSTGTPPPAQASAVRPAVMRAERGDKRRESFAVMQ